MTTVQKRSFTIDDIGSIPSVSSPQLSPDGSRVACVITETDGEESKDFIVIIDVSTREQRKLIEGSAPQWSPDGSLIAFEGEGGILICKPAGGPAELLAPVHVSDYFVDHYAHTNFCWSPDSQCIAYVSAGPEGQEEGINEFTGLLYKTKGGRGRKTYSDKRRNQVWIVSVKDRKPRQITTGPFAAHSLSWSPDGKQIAYISNITGKEDQNQWSDVFSVDVLNGETRQVSSAAGSSFQPQWSPDGKRIAYLAITGELSTNDSPAEDTQIFIVPREAGTSTCLTRQLDRRVEQIKWHPLSQSVFFTANDWGSTCLYRVSISTGRIEKVIDLPGKVYEYSLSDDGKKIVYTHTDSTAPPDIFLLDETAQLTIMLTSARAELQASRALQAAEPFQFTSFDNLSVQGWIMKPPDFDANRKYPAVLVIHGGPHNMFGLEFEDRMQVLSGEGYGVIFINPRGSSGYGQSFSNGCVGAWGEGDYEDLMAGVDYAIQNNSWIDASRMGVTGQSYGGYMTNRIITKTGRFRAAVADGSISNLVSFAGTSLYHSLMESEFGGSVYDNYELLWKCSPLKDVKKVTTPVLFVHGERDNEVPFSQAEEMFIAVKKLGVDSMLVQYKGEGHGWRPDLSLKNKKDLLKRMLSWFGKYL